MEEKKFYAENTLGKLAKWLRILGFDTIYEQGADSIEYDEKRMKNRILLSRKKELQHQRFSQSLIFITSDHVSEQLKQVVSVLNLGLSDIRPFSRCIRCNGLIEHVDKISVKGSVPDYVWETQATFQKCNQCQRIYWPGSHTSHAMDFIETVLRP